VVVALRTGHVAASYDCRTDALALSRALGVPVVPVAAHRRRGIDELLAALPHARRAASRPWAPKLAGADEKLAACMREILPDEPAEGYALAAERLVTGADKLLRYAHCHDEQLVVACHQARAELADNDRDPLQLDVADRYRWIEAVVADAVQGELRGKRTVRERVDAVLTHPILGLAVFGAIMLGLFVTIFTLAAPLMDAAEALVLTAGNWVVAALGAGPLTGLLQEGVVAGVGAVVVFVPQIALLFAILAFLEDSGYLARAAFLMDRLLCKVGLQGKSFIPLLSAHACAIPAVLATRNIENRRDRLATILVAPFMGCSARLPVYLLLIGALFASHGGVTQGLIMFGLYAAGILAAAVTAKLAGATVLRDRSETFLLELPPYQLPRIASVLRSMWKNSWLFVKKAGTVILAFSILLWAALSYPGLGDDERAEIARQHGTSVAQVEAALASDDPEASDSQAAQVAQAWQSAQLSGSVAGRIGHAIEPVIEPLGYDWKVGIGLLGAFAAREVFVSTMGVVYAVGDVEEDVGDGPLATAMLADTRADGSPLWTMPMALGLLCFFALAMQCISTVAVVRQETGGWRWPLAQLLWMNALAWLLAFAVYQIGSLL